MAGAGPEHEVGCNDSERKDETACNLIEGRVDESQAVISHAVRGTVSEWGYLWLKGLP